ncbi:MAG TPA: YdeI/OmpD-associated family protein [Opitutaceae bacterium]|nr:YdeI/OmpD-associated family protein [Opitutaceae bacterium]
MNLLLMNVIHFASAADFRRWLEHNHATTTELWVGFYRKDSGKGGLTYPEALDEALCFGWIDGIRKKAGADRYTSRFTPRKSSSIWSLVNLRHVGRLTAAGKMHASGLKAFAARLAHRTGVYAFEQKPQKLPAAYEKKFRANKKAWGFFTTQAPWYQRTAIHKVISPKQEATRLRWLNLLIADSAGGRRLDALTSPAKRQARLPAQKTAARQTSRGLRSEANFALSARAP